QAIFEQQLLEPQRPLLVVSHGEIVVRRHLLDRGARPVDVPHLGVAHGAVERERPPFPLAVERRLVRFRLHRTETLRAAHVVDAVHAASGPLASPVPIMESRVTSVASFSSLQPSVPAGRSGSTMKRVSAVESQTRIWVDVGSVTPKSASTPRGSITAREREGADL